MFQLANGAGSAMRSDHTRPNAECDDRSADHRATKVNGCRQPRPPPCREDPLQPVATGSSSQGTVAPARFAAESPSNAASQRDRGTESAATEIDINRAGHSANIVTTRIRCHEGRSHGARQPTAAIGQDAQHLDIGRFAMAMMMPGFRPMKGHHTAAVN
jgi:hypothetical protein